MTLTLSSPKTRNPLSRPVPRRTNFDKASLDGWHSQNILGILAIYSAWICKAMIMFSVACLIEFHCPLTFVGGNMLWLFYWGDLLLRWPLFKVSGYLGPSQQNRRWFRLVCLGSTHPAKWRFSSGSPTKHFHNPGGFPGILGGGEHLNFYYVPSQDFYPDGFPSKNQRLRCYKGCMRSWVIYPARLAWYFWNHRCQDLGYKAFAGVPKKLLPCHPLKPTWHLKRCCVLQERNLPPIHVSGAILVSLEINCRKLSCLWPNRAAILYHTVQERYRRWDNQPMAANGQTI